MKQLVSRWQTWALLIAVIIAGLVPGMAIFHTGTRAHAAGTTPTITPSITRIRAFQQFTVTAQGFAPHENVGVYFVLGSQIPPWGFLTCDGNGNCSGSVLAADLTQGGAYTLTGVGYSSGLKAQTSVTVLPGLSLSPYTGGQGTSVVLSGDCFAFNDTVHVYWGDTNGTLLGTASAYNGSGNWTLTFTVPPETAAGRYPITVVGSNDSPSTLVTHFYYLAPTLSIASTVHYDQNLQITVKGFEPDEQVTFSGNGSAGQSIPSITTNANGTGFSGFYPLNILPGTYQLVAHGSTSGFQASASYTLIQGIQLSSTQNSPGSTITVSGGGYQPNEVLHVFSQKTSDGTTTTTNALGLFSVPLTLPPTLSIGNNIVHVRNTHGTENAQATYWYQGPIISNSGPPFIGQQDEIQGWGFRVNETVTLYWEYGLTGQSKLGIATVDDTGSFQFFYTIPSEPNLSSVPIAAIGQSSGLTATENINPLASISIQPGSGPTGTQVQVSGGGFAAGETVAISLQLVKGILATTTADSTGVISTTITIPMSLGVTTYNVIATGEASNLSVSGSSSYFTITPILKLTPTTGPTGTQITVTGVSFDPSRQQTLEWYDPVHQTEPILTKVTTDSMGAFTVTVTAPKGLVKGNTYYILAYGDVFPTPQAAFVAS